MKILVTGACGFIGYALVEALHQENHEVIAFVYNDSKRSEKDFSVPVIRGDVRKREDLAKAGKVDCIHHFAANTDPTDFGVDMVESNVLGTHNILELARHHRSKVIVASSAAVYGNGPAPNRETDPVHPLNAYASSKIMSEYFCKAYAKEYHLDVVVFRYFNTYGVGEETKGKSASMIFHFVQSALATNAVEIYSKGEQSRDFLYVKDAIRANKLAMQQKGFKGEVFNVGTGKTTDFNTLVHKLQTSLGRDIRIRYVENPIEAFYQKKTEADLTAITRQLGFKLEYSLEKGIEEVITHYRHKAGKLCS